MQQRVMFCGTPVDNSSRGQPHLSLSPAEAELYAAHLAAQVAMGVGTLVKELLGRHLDVNLNVGGGKCHNRYYITKRVGKTQALRLMCVCGRVRQACLILIQHNDKICWQAKMFACHHHGHSDCTHWHMFVFLRYTRDEFQLWIKGFMHSCDCSPRGLLRGADPSLLLLAMSYAVCLFVHVTTHGSAIQCSDHAIVQGDTTRCFDRRVLLFNANCPSPTVRIRAVVSIIACLRSALSRISFDLSLHCHPKFVDVWPIGHWVDISCCPTCICSPAKWSCKCIVQFWSKLCFQTRLKLFVGGCLFCCFQFPSPHNVI